ADAARCDDGMRGGRAQLAKPREVGAAHGALASDIGREKRRAIGLELADGFDGSQRQRAPPPVNGDAALDRVESDDDSPPGDGRAQAAEKRAIDLPTAKSVAANDNLRDAKPEKVARARDRAHAAADSQPQSAVLPVRGAAQGAN